MDPFHNREDEQLRHVYHTPTRSAAKVLEEIIAQGSDAISSSSNSRHSLKRMNNNSQTPPPPPLPLHPPFFDAVPPQQSKTPPHLSSQASAHRTTTPPRDDDVRRHREKSSKSRTSKHTSKSLPRRLLEELERMDYTKGSRRTSPTDSHPGREEAHHHDPHYGRSRSSSDSISSLLAITTERLSYETIRANEAERQAAEVLELFKKTHEEKLRLERDLRRVQTELGLYKIQLDTAQKEIFKAQEIVNKLERERVAAEEEAARSRDKVHKLSEARAVEHAKQEARWLGFEEGLKQGRMIQPLIVDKEGWQGSRRSRRSEEENEVSRYTYPEEQGQQPSSSTSSSRHHNSKRYSKYPDRSTHAKTAPRTGSSIQSRPRRSSSAAPPPPAHRPAETPDVGTYSELLPRPTITTPMPVDVPNTQPQPAPAMPPHQPPNPIHNHTKHPEKINVQPSRDPNEPIRPISVRNMTPSVRHERIVLPPDNYIPTMGPDSVISLPPPHELSQPVAPEAPPPPPVQPSHPSSSRPRAGSHAGDTASMAYSYTARNGDNASRKYATMPSRTSFMSPGSTRLSELDLLSPPREGEIDYRNKGKVREAAASSTPSNATRGPPGQSPTQRIAEEWRNANKSYLRPISPPQGEPVMPRPPSSASGRRSRRPREVVLPVPLSEVMINTPSKRSAQLPPAPEGLTISMPPHAQRTTSNNTVPAIEVVTPSTHDSSRMSERTTVDPVLLTPDSAMRAIPLPTSDEHRDTGLGLYHNPNRPGDEERISMVLPDNNLPPGFVPLSPIPGMANLNPYPSGFGPSIPKDHPGSMSPNFTYPSSPFHRPS